MRYRIEWTNALGRVHYLCDESKVMEVTEAITKLGWEPIVTIDNDDEKV